MEYIVLIFAIIFLFILLQERKEKREEREWLDDPEYKKK